MSETAIPVTGKILEDLKKIFPTQVDARGGGRVALLEHLVPQVTEAKLEIFSNEHPPPHFRVTYDGKKTNYSLLDGSRLAKNREIGVKDREVLVWWTEHRVAMAQLWNRTRPGNCTVGEMEIPDEWL